jgi:hypothetical protein
MRGDMLDTEISKLVASIMTELDKYSPYYELGEDCVRQSIHKYIETEYKREVTTLNLKISLEKQRGLTKSEEVDRLMSEAKFIKYRMDNKVKAICKGTASQNLIDGKN